MTAARSQSTASLADEFFRELQAAKHFFPLLRRLSRPPATGEPRYVIYTDKPTARALRAVTGVDLPIVTQPAVARRRGGDDPVFLVVSLNREAILIKELKHTLDRAAKGLLLGFLRDIYPFILTRSNMLNVFDPESWDIEWIRRMRSIPARKVENVVSYCIVCTPRSGSHYLCDLLRSTGLGDPKEHTKGPFVYLGQHSRRVGFSPEHWARVMRAYAAESGTFGSKIVGHDLIKICKSHPGFLRLYDRVIYLCRRDKVMQTLSLIRARSKGVWHLRDDTPTRYSAVDYDYRPMLTSYRRLLLQEERLARLAGACDRRILLVEYESLVADPDGTVENIAAHVGRTRTAAPVSNEKIIRRNTDLRHAERFVRDAAADNLIAERNYRPRLPGVF